MTELATEPEAEAEEDKEEEEEEESLHDSVSEKLDGIFEGVSETVGDTRQAAVGGLSKGKRSTRTDESESSFTLDEEGNTTGTQELTQKGGAVGAGHHSKTDTGGVKGQVKTTNETELEGLAGAQWAAAFVKTADKDKLEAGIDVLAKAGAFGEARKKLAYRKGRLNAQMEAKGSGGAGVQGSLKGGASATKSTIPVIDRSFVSELELAIQIAVKAGLWADGEFNASASYGPLEASAFAKISALIGAELKMSGRAWVGVKEAGVEWEAEAFAGARVSGEAGVSVKLGPAELEASVEGEAMAGAEAKTSGNLKVGLKGVSAKVEAEAFAGAKAKVTGTAGFKIRGRTIVSVSGTAEVSVGAGATFKGEFTLENGVMRFGAELSASLGLGMGAGGGAMVDAGAIAKIIAADLREMSGSEGPVKSKSANFAREEIKDEVKADAIRQIGYNAVLDEFQLYAAKKTEEGDNVVKKDKVQKIINDAAIFHADKLKYREFDQGIKKAALEAFEGQVTGFATDGGMIREWGVITGAAVTKFKADAAAEAAQQKARDKLGSELAAYGATKLGEKKPTPVSKEEVQAIIAKHLPALRAAYQVTDTFGTLQNDTNAPVDRAVLQASDEFRAQWMKDLLTHQGGLIKTFEPLTQEEARKEAKDQADNVARAEALNAMGSALETYKAKVIADEKLSAPDLAIIQKHYNAAVKKAPDALNSAAGNRAAEAKITGSLAGLVSGVVVGGGSVSFRNVEGGLKKARDGQKAAADNAARTRAVDTFRANLAAYKEKMVAGGGSSLFGKAKTGLEVAEVKKALDLALKAVPGWAAWTDAQKDDFHVQLTTAAQEALGDALRTIILQAGQIRAFEPDNAKLLAAKDDRKLNGKKILTGGQEQDNDRRKLVADLVVPGLKTYSDKLRAAGQKSPTSPEAMPTQTRLTELITQGMKTVRADLLNSPVADKELTEHLRFLFPMITAVDVANMAITKIGVNPAYYSQRNEQLAVSTLGNQLLGVFTADLNGKVDLRRAEVQSLIYRSYPKAQGQPGHIVDKAMKLAVEAAITTVQEITIKDGVIQKFVEKKKAP